MPGDTITIEVRADALRGHVRRLCRPNLRSSRVRCCATCPFEAAVLAVAPELDREFYRKRKELERGRG